MSLNSRCHIEIGHKSSGKVFVRFYDDTVRGNKS